jgi:hypothetical protein
MSWQPMSNKTRARRSDASQSSQSSSSSQSSQSSSSSQSTTAAAAAAGTARARWARCAGGSELSTMNRNGCLLPELCFQMRIDIEAAASIQEADGGWLRLQTNARDVSLLQFRRQAVECRSARQALADGRAADASSEDSRLLYTVRQKQSCERRRVSVWYSTDCKKFRAQAACSASATRAHNLCSQQLLLEVLSGSRSTERESGGVAVVV